MPGNATERLNRYSRLKADRAQWDTLWQDLFNYILPRKSQITEVKAPGVEEYSNRINDDTASDANEVLASGLITNTTPPTETWVRFEAPDELVAESGGQAVAQDWFDQVNRITIKSLAASNFYSAVHEFHLERGAGGIGCIYVEQGKRNFLNFKAIPLGHYVIGRDSEGMVDTFQREFQLTARQAVQMFGMDAVGEKIRESYNNEQKRDQKFCFIHTVYPRIERDGSVPDALNKPYASFYDCKDTKEQVQEGGYDEMPYFVSVFYEWPGEIWGWGPGLRALPIIRQVNEIERNMDVLGEIAAFPRMLVPSGMMGTMDLGAGGITPIDESAGQFGQPREWLTQGRYDIGKDRSEDKRKAIRAAFHNPLFQMFSQLEPSRMTAYEAMRRESERLELFAPVFQRFTHEMLQPMMMRVFGILARAGAYPEFPQELLVPVAASANGAPVLEPALPKVTFQSKMSLALKALENRGFIEWMQIIAPLIQTNPEVLDPVDLTRSSEGVARNLSVPWIRTEQEQEELAEAKAAAAEQQQQAMMMAEGAKAAGALGKAPPGMLEQMGMS